MSSIYVGDGVLAQMLTPHIYSCTEPLSYLTPDTEEVLRFANIISFLDEKLGGMGFKSTQFNTPQLRLSRIYEKHSLDKYSYCITVLVNGAHRTVNGVETSVLIRFATNLPNSNYKSRFLFILGDGKKDCEKIVKTIKQKEDKLVRRIAMKKFEDAWDEATQQNERETT